MVLAIESEREAQSAQRSFWRHVAQMLTVLEWEQLQRLGEIRIISPAEGRELGTVA